MSLPKGTVPPPLELLDPTKPHKFIPPRKVINSEADVAEFQKVHAYQDIGQFLFQLTRALCPRRVPREQPTGGSTMAPPPRSFPAGLPSLSSASAFDTVTFSLSTKRKDPDVVLKLQALLDKVKALIDEAPPDTGPRRFGNISFRKFHDLLVERATELLAEFIPLDIMRSDEIPEGEPQALDELRAYFLGAFGSSQRLDYGTGHELSFLAFIGCLWKLGAFKDAAAQSPDGEVERSIVYGVFEPYFKVIRNLILTYTLEPAGSHGVWGLDDHFFLPYVFGSAQLTRPITKDEPLPIEGSVRGAPKPSDVVKAEKVELYREENMYFAAIGFIYDVKKGPFWEHSPILFDISGVKDGWGKINKGMIKMFAGEVLGKFPVVQHFPFGSLFEWSPATDPSLPAGGREAEAGANLDPDEMEKRMGNLPKGTRGTASAQYAITKAPWADK